LPDGELRLALEQALKHIAKPITASALRKQLPKPYQRSIAELSSALAALVGERRAFAVVAGRTTYYLDRDPEAALAQVIREALEGEPLTKTLLARRVKSTAPDFAGLLRPVLIRLVERGLVHEHPEVAKRRSRFGLAPPDPLPYLAKPLQGIRAVLKKLSRHGVTVEGIYEALGRDLGVAPVRGSMAPSPRSAPAEGADGRDEERVLAALQELSAREPPGTLLSLPALRRTTPDLDKARFDRAVLRLSSRGRVILHHHDFPTSLAPPERAALVEDERGTHYIGVALRRT
jgi:hypothetical protein